MKRGPRHARLSSRPAGALFAVALTACVLSACDGIGRPIVGTRPIGDGGEGNACDVTPACRPVRVVDPSHFEIAAERRRPPTVLDCDGDSVEDAVDNCPGVPNATQLDADCRAARDDCQRLLDGQAALAGADLRGCRIDAPIPIAEGLSLTGADLSCASLAFVGGAQPGTLDLSGATLTGTALDFATDEPMIVDLSATTLREGFLRVAGAARVHAEGSIFDRASVVVEPASGALGDGAPALAIVDSSFEQSTVYEGPAVRAGRVRFESSTIRASVLDVVAFEAVDVRMSGSQLGAEQLLVIGGEVTSMEVRTADGAFSATVLADVVFTTCEALRFFGAQLRYVDAPLCPPEGLRVESSQVIDARFAGGLSLISSRIEVSVLGGGPTSTIRSEESELEAVTLCDPGAGAFLGGTLRCVKCDEDAFMGGAAVCIGGARLFERGCPALELAPFCG